MLEELKSQDYKSPYAPKSRPKSKREVPLSPIQRLVRLDIQELPVENDPANLNIPQSARNTAGTHSARSEARTPKKKTPRNGSMQLKTPVAQTFKQNFMNFSLPFS